jgi:two-component system phosphate regulon sensor histidine kinase PhoR
MKNFLKIFLIITIPVIIILLIYHQSVENIVKKSLRADILESMRNSWHIVNQLNLTEHFNMESYKKIRKISENTKLRITVIRKDGVVIYDSFLNPEQIKKMENHRNRPEVKKAMFNPDHEGYNIRFSHTLKRDMFYYAKPAGKSIILRIAYPLEKKSK